MTTVVPTSKLKLVGRDSSWLVRRLSQFRRDVESDLEQPLEEFVVPAILVLDDLCNYLELQEAARRAVLGLRGVEAVDRIVNETFAVMEPEVSVAEAPGPIH